MASTQSDDIPLELGVWQWELSLYLLLSSPLRSNDRDTAIFSNVADVCNEVRRRKSSLLLPRRCGRSRD